MNTKQFIEDSGYGWPVGKFPAYMKVGDKFIEVENRAFTARTDFDVPEPFEAVSRGYEVFQNVEAFDFLNSLVNDGELELDTIMGKGNGHQVIINTKMPGELTIAGSQVARYLCFSTAHDGSGSNKAFPHAMQLVCTNQLQSLQMASRYGVSIRHTKNSRAKLLDAHKALREAIAYGEELKKLGDRLATEKVSGAYYNKFLRDLVQLDSIDRKKNPRKHRAALGARYAIHETIAKSDYMDDYKGTKWMLYQGVTHYTSNIANPRMHRTNKFTKLASGHPLANRAMKLLTEA